MYGVMLFLRDRSGLYTDGGLVYAADPDGIEEPITQFSVIEAAMALERIKREAPAGAVAVTVSLN